jgi:thymidine kinase
MDHGMHSGKDRAFVQAVEAHGVRGEIMAIIEPRMNKQQMVDQIRSTNIERSKHSALDLDQGGAEKTSYNEDDTR